MQSQYINRPVYIDIKGKLVNGFVLGLYYDTTYAVLRALVELEDGSVEAVKLKQIRYMEPLLDKYSPSKE